MSIKTVTADELRRMNGAEGLILQGCGGDPQEWLDGINGLLTDEGILKNGSRFENIGNGCRPDSLGTKVFGFHVTDGEKTYYRRTEFVGALKEELIPEWAEENTRKYLEADDLADEPDEDGGMTMNL